MPTLYNNSRTVQFSRSEVRLFRTGWPCCKLALRSYWFEFDSEGNLIDHNVPTHRDGPESLALSAIAGEYLLTVTQGERVS